MERFRATIEPVPGGGHFVVVPPKSADAAGLVYGMRVRGTLAGTAYRSSLMKYSGVFHLGVHKATLAAAGVGPGATVDITIEHDDEPLPTDTLPPDLAKALAKNPAAKAGFAAQSPAHKREHVKFILEAKQAATRARRIAKTVETLAQTKPKTKPKPAKKPARR
ncbi:MAG TPA: YdeI/OmpD-associated family protein [Kofleriaceae bacterium]|nr:YdeI/OmpD-associated family protein [Kofleriaceae bacterium]